MSDIVDRLRKRTVTRWVHSTGTSPRTSGRSPDNECIEAAFEIETLRETLKRQSKAHHIEVQEQVAAERERCAQIVREAWTTHGLCCTDAEALAAWENKT